VDTIEIGVPDMAIPAAAADAEPETAPSRASWIGYVAGAAASVATGLVCWWLLRRLDLTNIAMLFLLSVLLVAIRFGRGPSVVATVASVLTFDYFFVPPQFTFAIADLQYLVTFGVMLAAGLITGHLTAGLQFQARVAASRESRWRALYEFSRELSGTLQTEQIFDITRSFVAGAFRARATLLLPDDAGRLQVPAPAAVGAEAAALSALDLGIAQWSFDRAEPAGLGTDTLPASALFYLPLVAPMRTRGVLAIEPERRRWMLIPEQRQQLDTFAALAAIALERVHYIEVAQGALVNMESERLRNSLLAALSHDLRTPLTLLVGVSEALARSVPLSDRQRTMARTLHDESLRMSALVTNLLDMARIQSGEVHLNLEWQPLEEVVGSALRASANVLRDHVVRTLLPPGLPLLHLDAPLIERVLCNLFENAAKYTPAGSVIVVSAQLNERALDLLITDNGPGLPAGREEAVFEKFMRGERESSKPGIGLGLAICRAIVEAHGGRISGRPASAGGAQIVVSFRRGTPPPMPRLEEVEGDEHA
jgi:two-component system sensor histidine kinase KdpD